MNSYQHLAAEYVRLANEARSYPLGTAEQPAVTPLPVNAPKVLVFSPHPDDEAIVGGLALRLLREAQWKVINVAVTQGSNKERQSGRFQELKNCCRYLGFDVVQTAPNGLEKVNAKTRDQDPTLWVQSVKTIAGILSQYQPKVVFCPHELDWNSTHIGTHFLVIDAFKTLPASFSCYVVETEFWGQMASPNLMVEITAQQLGDLMTGLTFHIGEVQRNPYHLSLPGWMIDNVRRGSELVGGQGGAAPSYLFATLYRLRQWRGGKLESIYSGGKQLTAAQDPKSLFT